jgi:hypothetical protein
MEGHAVSGDVHRRRRVGEERAAAEVEEEADAGRRDDVVVRIAFIVAPRVVSTRKYSKTHTRASP